jgi:hypothetical protein
MYVRIHTEKHSVLNGLKEYGYVRIDDFSKVRDFMKGIKTLKLDVFNTQVMASPILHGEFHATVEFYSTLIKQMKADNPQINVSEVSFARGKISNKLVWKARLLWNLHVKLLPLPQPPGRACTDARTNPSSQRANQLRSVLARVYAVSIQNQITNTVP